MLQRRTPMRRTAFRRREGPNVAAGERPLAPIRPLAVVPNYGGGLTGPEPKSESYRDPALLDMARNRPCLLLVPGCCNHRIDGTCACHENQGKGMGIKQSDDRSVWGCTACHAWYDRSGASRETKRAAFDAAHPRQILAWRAVAADPSEPARFRRAAQRALDRLNAQGAA